MIFNVATSSTKLCCSLVNFFVCQDNESSVMCCVKNEPEGDEKLTCMRSVVELETISLARYIMTT